LSRRSKTKRLQENASGATALALELARDKKFRRELRRGLGHGAAAQRRARRGMGRAAVARRLASDRQFRSDVAEMTRNLRAAWTRAEKKRSHGLRNTLLAIVGVGGAAAAATPSFRSAVKRKFDSVDVGGRSRPRTISGEVEVAVPVSTAYNQWTQFEEFPRFMEGVEEVRQLDDTRLHWVARVAGRSAAWDAKILEQHPDEQISWISEDGRKTRGTVTFEAIGDSRTLVRLSMSYQTQGLREALGSAAGLDARRVHGDLQRFKRMIEERNDASGAWRGDISAGVKA
jgi:uncharacterized membrane protein